MEFEWDEAKRRINLIKHGIDFIDAELLFDGRPVCTIRSVFPNEERYLTTGIIEDHVVTVVWTQRGERLRLISARRARDAERRAYRALYQ
ncbi:MAG TPA: BrnT family toxin [Thermomicrobiaceae bacterium]|nr:BrnT family toxin [Thermomicrobiaceae bacterium]